MPFNSRYKLLQLNLSRGGRGLQAIVTARPVREKHWTIIVGGTLLGPSHARETLDNYCGWDLARTQPCARNTGQLLWVGPCSDPAMREKHWTIIVGGTLLGPSHARETLDNYCGWDLARTQPCARNTGQLLWVGPCSDPAMREKHWTIIVGGTLLGPSHARELYLIKVAITYKISFRGSGSSGWLKSLLSPKFPGESYTRRFR